MRTVSTVVRSISAVLRAVSAVLRAGVAVVLQCQLFYLLKVREQENG